ncbi:MAG: M23 family metallopeptidase [Candidatus Magasanikbacteria bacterium]|nr:M23 family metallopeptidase [Candidatus Magasanikbacteria bacterium]
MLLGPYRQDMKYKVLLKILHLLIGLKRFSWWLGSKMHYVLAKFSAKIWRFFAFWNYKLEYYLRRVGWGKDQIWWLKRDNLQLILLAVLFISALPQTKLLSKEIGARPGQNTIAYQLFGPGEDYGVEEIVSGSNTGYVPVAAPVWRTGAVESEPAGSGSQENVVSTELGMMALGGGAVIKPSLIPGMVIVGVERKNIINYTIEPGDSLSSIAYRYGISVATLMWENSLGVRSIIRPGDAIRIPPTTGVMHTIKKGDTLKKIAAAYGSKQEDIIKFNNLKEDGTDLVIGEKIMVPGGAKQEAPAVRTPLQYTATQGKYAGAKPASSAQAPTVAGYVWPTAARTITQYYGWRHYGLDLAGPMNTANYAARAGTVIKSQCGWNNGYGCEIMIDHGNGVVTLYGHNNKLLVSVGDQVTTGQTIGLMGNTGNVRGRTGIHLHFEVRVNGARMNPLKYVR